MEKRQKNKVKTDKISEVSTFLYCVFMPLLNLFTSSCSVAKRPSAARIAAIAAVALTGGCQSRPTLSDPETGASKPVNTPEIVMMLRRVGGWVPNAPNPSAAVIASAVPTAQTLAVAQRRAEPLPFKPEPSPQRLTNAAPAANQLGTPSAPMPQSAPQQATERKPLVSVASLGLQASRENRVAVEELAQPPALRSWDDAARKAARGPAPVWDALPYASLRQVVSAWGEVGGIRVDWQSRYDYELPQALRAVAYSGTFQQALGQLASKFGELPNPLSMKFSNDGLVLRVTDKAAENAAVVAP